MLPPTNTQLPETEDAHKSIREQWIREQESLQQQIVQHDHQSPLRTPAALSESGPRPAQSDAFISSAITASTSSADSCCSFKRIGGLDISFIKTSPHKAVCGLVVLDYPSLDVIYEEFQIVNLTVPYIPGFLAFREAPPLVEMVKNLRKTQPDLAPQVLFVDGNGVFHPRGCGLASHLGVLLDMPTVGVTKKVMAVDGMSKTSVLELAQANLKKAGDFCLLTGASSPLPLGAVYRSTSETTNPVVVSVGHRISLETCLSLMPDLCKFRVCEPIRQADLRSREYIRLNHLESTPNLDE